MKEKNLHHHITSWVLESFPDAWIYKTADKFRHGVPDFIGCAGGRMIAIEAKWDHHLTRLQEVTLKKISGAQGLAFVWKKWEIYFIDSPTKTWDPREHSLKDVLRDSGHGA